MKIGFIGLGRKSALAQKCSSDIFSREKEGLLCNWDL